MHFKPQVFLLGPHNQTLKLDTLIDVGYEVPAKKLEV